MLWRHAQPEPSSSSSFCRKPLHVSALWCHARPQSRGFLCAAAHSYTLLHYGTTRGRTSSWSPPRFRTIVPRAAGHPHRLLCAAAHSYTFFRAMLQCAAGQPRGFLCVSAHSSTLPRYVATRGRTASSSPTCIRTFLHGSALCCLTASSFICAAAIWRRTPRRFLRVPHPPPQCRAMAPRAAILDASSTTVLPRRALAAMKGRTVVVQSIYRSRHWIVVAVTNDVDLSSTVTLDIC